MIWKEIRYSTGTWSIERYFVRNIFMEKLYWKSSLITIVIPLIYIWGKQLCSFVYYGTSEGEFKSRYKNYTKSFRHRESMNETELRSWSWYIHTHIYIYIYIISLIRSFSFCWPLLKKMIKLNPKVYDLINWLKRI